MDDNNINPQEDFSFSQDFGETEEDALSLSDLPIHGQDPDLDTSCQSRSGSTSSNQDPFEFSGRLIFESQPRNFVFFGKNNQIADFNLEEYRNRDNLRAKAASFHVELSSTRRKSSSLRFARSERFHQSPVQKVNITAITSMSMKSKRWMFMLPVKFKPEMDVVAIKKRQICRHPTQIPPIAEDGDQVSGSNGRGKSSSGCMSHLVTGLGRMCGCISAPSVGK